MSMGATGVGSRYGRLRLGGILEVTGKTIKDLKQVREQLNEQLVRAAYALTGGINQRALERLVQINEAIYALDAVIEDGRSEPSE